MDQAFMQRAQQYPTMNAVQNMQSYEQIAEEHAKRVHKVSANRSERSGAWVSTWIVTSSGTSRSGSSVPELVRRDA
jgi:hypothetical protein